jgi:ribosomal protein S7
MVQKSLKSRCINLKMKQGKKSLCEKQLFTSFKIFQKNNRKNMNILFKHALMKLTPFVTTRKVTRTTDNSFREYPYVLKKNRRIVMGLNSLVKNPSILDCLSTSEWIKVLKEKAEKKNLLQKQIIQQKKLLRYRWFI